MSLDKLLLKSKTNYKVYTPEKVAREIVAKALSFYFSGRNKKEKLLKIRAIDLSCGNGNLLLVLLESLIKLHKICFGQYRYIDNWVEGFDLDKKALNEFNFRFNLLLKKYGLSGNLNLKNTDSLTHSFKKSYNIIIGNPPYLGEKNNKEIFDRIRVSEFGQRYYEGKMDYLYFFIEKGLELLETDGVLSYITTNYFLRADGAKKLRYIIKEDSSLVYLNNINKSVFKEAIGQHNMIFTLKKSYEKMATIVYEDEVRKMPIENLFDDNGKISILNDNDFKFCEKLEKIAHFRLGEKCSINQGIVSGHDAAFVFDEYQTEFSQYLKPFYKNKDILKYKITEPEYYILYLDGKKEPSDKLLEYLKPYKDRLAKRREVLSGRIKWWQLQWSRNERIFLEPKIVARQRNRENNFALVYNEFYASADVYYISNSQDVSIEYILAYLNSEVFYRWFKLRGKYKGEFLELYATPLKEVPIIYENDKRMLKEIEELSKIQMNEFNPNVQEKLNRYFYKKLGESFKSNTY